MSFDLSDVESDHVSRSDDEANNLDNNHESANVNDENGNNENESDTGRRIDPATSRKRIVRNPIPKLNTARLRGPKGVHTIEKYFEGFKFHKKGHEKNDLDRIMKRLEHWAHRLFPKYQFDDFLEKVEMLGTKRDLQTFLTKYRRDMLSDDAIIPDTDGDAAVEREPSPEPVDEFDLLIAEQIEKTKQVTMSQATSVNVNVQNTNVESTTKQISPSSSQQSNGDLLNDEIKKRIEKNRQLAIERRLARLKRDEENKKRKAEEILSVCNKTSQKSDVTEIDQNNSIIERISFSGDEIPDLNNKNHNNDETESTKNLSMIDKNELVTKYQPISNRNATENPLLTDDELNTMIDNAVNQFMKKKRQSN